jgi:hypothetical protein
MLDRKRCITINHLVTCASAELPAPTEFKSSLSNMMGDVPMMLLLVLLPIDTLVILAAVSVADRNMLNSTSVLTALYARLQHARPCFPVLGYAKLKDATLAHIVRLYHYSQRAMATSNRACNYLHAEPSWASCLALVDPLNPSFTQTFEIVQSRRRSQVEKRFQTAFAAWRAPGSGVTDVEIVAATEAFAALAAADQSDAVIERMLQLLALDVQFVQALENSLEFFQNQQVCFISAADVAIFTALHSHPDANASHRSLAYTAVVLSGFVDPEASAMWSQYPRHVAVDVDTARGLNDVVYKILMETVRYFYLGVAHRFEPPVNPYPDEPTAAAAAMTASAAMTAALTPTSRFTAAQMHHVLALHDTWRMSMHSATLVVCMLPATAFLDSHPPTVTDTVRSALNAMDAVSAEHGGSGTGDDDNDTMYDIMHDNVVFLIYMLLTTVYMYCRANEQPDVDDVACTDMASVAVAEFLKIVANIGQPCQLRFLSFLKALILDVYRGMDLRSVSFGLCIQANEHDQSVFDLGVRELSRIGHPGGALAT